MDSSLADPRARDAESDEISVLLIATVSETIEAFFVPHIDYWRSLGWNVTLASGSDTSSKVECASLGFNRSVRSVSLRSVMRTRRTIRSANPKVLLCTTPIAGLVSRLAALGTPAKVVYFVHGFHFSTSSRIGLRELPFWFSERFLAGLTSQMIVINRDDFDFVKGWRTWRPKSCYLLPGVGAVVPSVSREPSGEGVLIGFLGRLDENKSLDLLLRSLALLDTRYRLRVVGDGPAMSDCVNLAKRLGLTARVDFCGFDWDPWPRLQSVNMLVNCSSREGLPISVIEAMSIGIPVAATPNRGTVELLRNGGGMIAEGRDPVQLAQTIETVAERQQELGHEARERSNEFTVGRVVPALASLLEAEA